MTSSMRLIPYSPEHCRDAFAHIMKWAADYGGDLADAYMATTRLTEYCSLAYNDTSIYGIFLPDYGNFSKNVFRFHGIVTPEGQRRRREHRAMMSEYFKLLFSKGVGKIVTEFPAFVRLNAFHLEALGFQQEGVFRREWEHDGELYDIHRYSLFEDDFMEALNGQEEKNLRAASSRPLGD